MENINSCNCLTIHCNEMTVSSVEFVKHLGATCGNFANDGVTMGTYLL